MGCRASVAGSAPVSSVTYAYDADVRDGDVWRPLPVVSITPSVDLDRVPYTAAVITVGALTEEHWNLLDPRTVDPHQGGQVRWRLRQLNLDGTVAGYLPHVTGTVGEWATMFVRALTRNLDSVNITAHGGETMVEDRLVIEDTSRLTSPHEISKELATARNLGEYVDAVLSLTFGPTHATPSDPLAVTAAAVPAYSTLTVPGMHLEWPAPAGVSFIQLVETELSSVGCRLLDAWGCGWFIADRDKPLASGSATVRWSSYEDAPAGAEPIIVGFDETISRGGDWADTVVVTGENGLTDDTRTWRHVAAGGTKSRGQVIQMQSAEPSGNLAASIASRAFRRGHDITITARIRLNITPGMPVHVHLRSGTLTAEIKSIEWDIESGEMTVHARSAQTVDADDVSRETSNRISAGFALDEARRAAAQALAEADVRADQKIASYDAEKERQMRAGWSGRL